MVGPFPVPCICRSFGAPGCPFVSSLSTSLHQWEILHSFAIFILVRIIPLLFKSAQFCEFFLIPRESFHTRYVQQWSEAQRQSMVKVQKSCHQRMPSQVQSISDITRGPVRCFYNAM